ncbi:MAG TPA: metal-dependent hydrolase [Spirochaetia bacterium]|nr:metal-dependent hydrolase [Spirochaetia bacterium]
MFLLAHTGITAAVAWLINSASRKDVVEGTCGNRSYLFTAYPQPEPENVNNVDFRLIILGSVLPDIIDKPFELFFPHLGLGTGRGMAHTLIFNFLLVGIGWYLYRRGRPGFLYMALTSTGHLVLDRMWDMPAVLLWPFMGVHFPPVGLPGVVQVHVWWRQLFADPRVWVPEVIGGAIWVGFAVNLTKSHGWRQFLRRGLVP